MPAAQARMTDYTQRFAFFTSRSSTVSGLATIREHFASHYFIDHLHLQPITRSRFRILCRVGR